MRSLVIVFMAGLSVACGTVGSPVPPETVGVARTIEEQKRQDAIKAQQREAAEFDPEAEVQGQDVDLPPLRPVGTR
jgi:hypothetical protein